MFWFNYHPRNPQDQPWSESPWDELQNCVEVKPSVKHGETVMFWGEKVSSFHGAHDGIHWVGRIFMNVWVVLVEQKTVSKDRFSLQQKNRKVTTRDDWNSRFFQSFLWCEFLVQVFSQILQKDIDFSDCWVLRTSYIDPRKSQVLICLINYILFLCCVCNRILYHFLQMKVEFLSRWFEIFLILTACGYDPIWLQYYFFNIF